MARAGAAGTARHPHQHARHRPGRHRQGAPVRRAAAGRPLGRRTARVRPARLLLQARPGLRPARWRTARRRCTGSRIRRSAWPPGSSTTTRAVTQLIARVFDGQTRRPDARRRPRQHHALLADEHGRLVGSSLLGEQACLLRPEGRHHPGRRERLSRRALSGPAELGGAGVSQARSTTTSSTRAATSRPGSSPQLFTAEMRAAFRSLR